MNGRIFDPLIGRFMSADPFIQFPGNLQSYNRYAYVMNNPLAFTDPSGYFSWRKLFRASVPLIGVTKVDFQTIRSQPGQRQADQIILKNPALNSIGLVVSTALTGFCGGCGGAIWSAYYTYQATGSMTAANRAGAITYATGRAFGWAGDVGETTGTFGHYAAHALVGCASSAAQGASCGAGALSGVAGLAGTPYGFEGAVIAGGFASVIGGGKFADGAVIAGFGYRFNCRAHNDCWGRPETLQDHFDRHGGDFGSKNFHGLCEASARLS